MPLHRRTVILGFEIPFTFASPESLNEGDMSLFLLFGHLEVVRHETRGSLQITKR